MAINLRGVNEYPYYKTFDVDTSTTLIELPGEAKTITIGSETTIIYVVQNGATDGGVLPDDYIFVPSNNVIPIKLGIGLQRKNIFVAAKTGTGKVCIQLTEY